MSPRAGEAAGGRRDSERSAAGPHLLSDLESRYAPGHDRPLGGYMVLTGTFASGVAAALLALRRSGREIPEHPALSDVVLVGVATHKLSRLIAKDKATSFLRAPFTHFQHSSGHGEVEEKPCGHGVRLAVGELLVCPYCLSQWVAAAFTLGLIAAPRATRLAGAVFASYTDFLQLAYRAAEDRV